MIRLVTWSLALILACGFCHAQSQDYFMKVEVDTSQMRGDAEIIRTIRTGGGIAIPDGPIDIPLNQHQRATFRKDKNETYLSAVNMMNQVVIRFPGDQAGEFDLPENPTSMPKVRVFLADIQPVLEGSLISGKIVISDYVPGEYISGTFAGEERVAGYDLYFAVRGKFRLPSQVR